MLTVYGELKFSAKAEIFLELKFTKTKFTVVLC